MAFCIIDKNNYFHNLSLIEQKIKKEKIAVVLKNNAYGHGLKEIAQLSCEYGIKHAVVNLLREASLIESYFETVLVLQDIPSESLASDNIIVAINSIDVIKNIPPNTKVEIKVDTGMHRNGIMIDELNNALDLIIKNKLNLCGIFTHFSNAYEEDKSLDTQKKKFDKVKNNILSDYRFNSVDIRFHCCASSSLFRINANDYDLARVGIMSYGYISLPNSFDYPNLKPVMSLWAEKITSKVILKGDSVGYGSIFTAENKMVVSTYDVGYGDGFLRLDGTKDSTIEDGRKILGIVSMNSFSTYGDDSKVCVFKNAYRFAKLHNTIIYEIISNINPYIERIVR